MVLPHGVTHRSHTSFLDLAAAVQVPGIEWVVAAAAYLPSDHGYSIAGRSSDAVDLAV